MDGFSKWWNDCGEWSERTFGHGQKGEPILKHIEKEIREARDDMEQIDLSTASLEEWCDIVQLAIDGVRRAGFSCDDFVEQLNKKLEINKSRSWNVGEDGVCEHVRD